MESSALSGRQIIQLNKNNNAKVESFFKSTLSIRRPRFQWYQQSVQSEFLWRKPCVTNYWMTFNCIEDRSVTAIWYLCVINKGALRIDFCRREGEK